jgi:uncharacterized protein YjbI with pentapeptide repeats
MRIQEHVNRINQGVEAWNEFDDAFAKYLDINKDEEGFYCFDQTQFNTRLGENVSFKGAKFCCEVSFNESEFGRIVFNRAKFSDRVSFNSAKFHGKVYFENAEFKSASFFELAEFDNDAEFKGATFNGHAGFNFASFSMHANFMSASFNKEANFIEATFSGMVTFGSASFSRDADFQDSCFSGRAHFDNAKFDNDVCFINVESKSLLTFTNVLAKNSAPMFAGIVYKTPPIIDGLSVSRPDKNLGSGDMDVFRQLKMIAIAGANHEKEVEFFGYETQCKLYLDETHWSSKLLIWSYWKFSNFGQSILRPILGLGVMFLVASALTHISVEARCDPVACENVEHTGAFESKSDAAWSQSIDFILPILKADRGTLRQRNQCLYGHDGVPGINRLINFIQQIVSLVFLFLAGLGIRNRFKIK